MYVSKTQRRIALSYNCIQNKNSYLCCITLKGMLMGKRKKNKGINSRLRRLKELIKSGKYVTHKDDFTCPKHGIVKKRR